MIQKTDTLQEILVNVKEYKLNIVPFLLLHNGANTLPE